MFANVPQTTLSERVVSDAALALYSDDEIESMTERATALSHPTPDDVSFNLEEWTDFVSDCTSALAIAVRESVSDPRLKRSMAALAMVKSGEKALLDQAVNLTVSDEAKPWMGGKVRRLLYMGFQRVPLNLCPILAGWIPEVSILSKDEYIAKVGLDSSGYYHPDEHWIALSYDAGESEPRGWPLSKSGTQELYEKSVTLHELGHALHYMLGLQTEHADTLDNRERDKGDWCVKLREDVERADWQVEQVVKPALRGYGNLERGVYDDVEWKDTQSMTVEEFIAEGFTAWATSPRYLKQEQPVLWQLFDDLKR